MENKFYMYKGTMYPACLKQGHAAENILHFASFFCKGKGLDIGGLKDSHYPGAKIINKNFPDEYHAFNLPAKKFDYIFSSHTLEHILECRAALMYWRWHLKKDGVLFLYLPHPDMEYWHPGNDLKHHHIFTPEEISSLLKDCKYDVMACSKRDSFYSFSVVALNGGK